MANRVEAPDSLDDFPTPPWGTRALLEHVLARVMPLSELRRQSVREPAANRGLMAEVLREYFGDVHASDVHDYGAGYPVGSYVGNGPDVVGALPTDWLVTNPPFNLALAFVLRALEEAANVAVLLRTAWSEGGERYEELFSRRPPNFVGVFVERLPMHKGRWDPDGASATAYNWFVWAPAHAVTDLGPVTLWIPPGCRGRLTKPDDVARFACAVEPAELPLFEGAR